MSNKKKRKAVAKATHHRGAGSPNPIHQVSVKTSLPAVDVSYTAPTLRIQVVQIPADRLRLKIEHLFRQWRAMPMCGIWSSVFLTLLLTVFTTDKYNGLFIISEAWVEKIVYALLVMSGIGVLIQVCRYLKTPEMTEETFYNELAGTPPQARGASEVVDGTK